MECCSLNLLAGTEELGMVKYFTNYLVFTWTLAKLFGHFLVYFMEIVLLDVFRFGRKVANGCLLFLPLH